MHVAFLCMFFVELYRVGIFRSVSVGISRYLGCDFVGEYTNTQIHK